MIPHSCGGSTQLPPTATTWVPMCPQHWCRPPGPHGLEPINQRQANVSSAAEATLGCWTVFSCVICCVYLMFMVSVDIGQ